MNNLNQIYNFWSLSYILNDAIIMFVELVNNEIKNVDYAIASKVDLYR